MNDQLKAILVAMGASPPTCGENCPCLVVALGLLAGFGGLAYLAYRALA